MATNNVFVHHVYFWLTNSGSKEDKNALLAGLQKLSSVKTILQFVADFKHLWKKVTVYDSVSAVS